ncbi:MAG: DeoR/GlpR family DNA-binding transcription regulator [Clostridiales bacterium]|nr:DeoR/GlpR family DNA-binding transcription regulator [Clostridiales bacterium]
MQEKRLNDILRYVAEHEMCTHEELCRFCDVSLSTVKRDVQTLSDRGLLTRVRGGAKALADNPADMPRTIFRESLRYQSNLDRIAKRASQLVSDNEIVFLGSGVTVAHMIKHLRGYRNLTVITNSIYVMQEAFQYDINVLMIGGILNRNTMSYIGIQSINQLKDLNANAAFMSCNGIALTRGITNSSEMEGDIKKIAVQVSAKSILLADNEKFNKISLYTFAQMGDFTNLITDQPIDEPMVREIKDSGTELVVVEE